MSEILIDSELLSCPICADTFVDACDTGCGHTFCDFCLNSCLENRPDKCPVCSKDPSPVHPAFTIRAICNAFAPHVVEDTTITVESEKELGNSSYYKNKYAQAILHYNNAINKCTHSDPKNSYLYNNRSQCFIHLRQFKRALDDCDEAIRLNDDNIKAYMRKGLCLRMLGLFEESRVAYNKATNLDKNSEWKQQIQDGIRFLPASTPAQQAAAQQQQPQQPQQPQQQPQRPQQPQQPAQPQQPFNPQQPQYYFPYGQPPQGYPNSQYPQFNQQHARYQYPGHYTVRTTGNPNQNFHPNYAYQQQVPPQQQNQPIHQQPQQPQAPPSTTTTTQPTNVNTTVPSSSTTSSSTSSSTSAPRAPTTTAPVAPLPTTTATTASTSTSSNGKGRNRSSSGNCKSQ